MEIEQPIIESKDKSSEIENVTLQKIKNPGRQEWGRKLGKMSKEMKIKKQQANIQNSVQIKDLQEKPVLSSERSASDVIRWEYALGLVGTLISLRALYNYLYSDNIKDSKCSMKDEPESKFSDF